MYDYNLKKNVEYWNVIHFLWLKNKSAKEIHEKMQETYGDACPSLSMVNYWIN